MTLDKHLSERKLFFLVLISLIALAAIMRCVFVHIMDIAAYDPWRHLQLLKNIRNGDGFTLFNGQPYIWYSPLWYYVASFFDPWVKVQWVSCLASLLSVPIFFLFLLKTEKSLMPAVVGGVLMAAFGPMIAFTCTYGSESFALLLMLSALLLCAHKSHFVAVLIGGILFGTVLICRMNFLFNFLIFIPILKSRRNLAVFLSGAMLILCLVWWRNHLVINSYDYIFTWDGLATKSEDYSIMSTLVPQMHPAVIEATRTLYESIAPIPQWLYSGGEIAWGTILFVLLGSASLVYTRRPYLIAAGLLPMIYFNLFDRTLSSNFFRHYVALFPLFFIGIALAVKQILHDQKALSPYSYPISISVVMLVVLSGISFMKPLKIPVIECVIPPSDMLTEEHYMVNSGFYHPESLIYSYPDKKFIGMPFYPEQFDDFSRCYPQYNSIICHIDFNVQKDLLKHLIDSGKYRVDGAGRNKYGVKYLLLKKETAESRQVEENDSQ